MEDSQLNGYKVGKQREDFLHVQLNSLVQYKGGLEAG